MRLLAFDSGIGGLGIVAALRRIAPAIPVDYLADNAIYPYGELSEAVLLYRLRAVIGNAIETLQPDAVVVACNTASTAGLAGLREWFAVPFVGCVPPIKWAAALSETRTIGLLATAATVKRRYLHDLRDRFAPDCTLLAHGARGLADQAEAVFRGHPADLMALRREVDMLFDQPGGAQIDVVGIGCTHYSFLLDVLHVVSPRTVHWIDPADAVARQAITVLNGLNKGSTPDQEGRVFFTAPPLEPERLEAGLAAAGYADGFDLLTVPTGAVMPATQESPKPSFFGGGLQALSGSAGNS